MTPEVFVHVLSPSLAVWHCYDPSVKADLFATKISTPAGVYLIDPIPLPSPTLSSLLGHERVAGIIVTNGNHARAADDFSCTLDVPIHAHPDSRSALTSAEIADKADGDSIAPGLKVITIDGAGSGEIALHSDAEGGTLILGDALINMDALGFTFLPAKYCTNPRLMRKSLLKLLRLRFQRILFAHGTPIVSQAERRLAELLNGHQSDSRS